MDSQVTIHVQDKVLHFDSASALAQYVDLQRKEGGYMDPRSGKWVETWQHYDHLPLLTVVDDTTGERFTYVTLMNLPNETVKNSEGKILLSLVHA